MGDLTLYGIRNCDTMKKARAWLDAHGVEYTFHDYRADGVERAPLERWMNVLGWESLVNRAGPTFRRLPEPERTNLDGCKAIELMLAHPSLIRRPVLESRARGLLLVGFRPQDWEHALGGAATRHP